MPQQQKKKTNKKQNTKKTNHKQIALTFQKMKSLSLNFKINTLLKH